MGLHRCFVAAAITVLLALALAGPAQAAGEPYEVTTADGVTLRGWLHLPPGKKGPFATVLEFTPYLDNPGPSRDDVDPYAFLLDEGYAFVRVSVRGTGRSGGCLRFGDRVDVSDVTHVINDVAKQKWSTGKVGMIGQSYPAWTQDMAVTTAPKPLKAVVPIDGVTDVWNLLTRVGAPIVGGLGTLFSPIWTAETSVPNEGVLEHARCPNLPSDYTANAETATTGDRTAWFHERDLREPMRNTRVPMLRFNGLLPLLEGHILQIEGLWDRLRADRTRFVLGQYMHKPPTPEFLEGRWIELVTKWFDHHLRGGPELVETGRVDYQDDTGEWHTTTRWPPPAKTAAFQLSGDTVIPEGETPEPATQTFASADIDPGINTEANTDDPDGPRTIVAACGPHQALWTSSPLPEDVRLAGNFEFDVTLTSTLPGGNFAVALWRTSGPGTCPDSAGVSFARSHMDLRHWAVEGLSRDFPVGQPTTFTVRSQPFATQLKKGDRLVVAIGGGAVEMQPDPLHPVLTVDAGRLRLPVIEGPVNLQDSGATPAPEGSAGPDRGASSRRCRSRRRFRIRLREPRRGRLVSARVFVNGKRVNVVRARRRLVATVDLRGLPDGRYRVRIVAVTSTGRRVVRIRRYRTCTPTPAELERRRQAIKRRRAVERRREARRERRGERRRG